MQTGEKKYFAKSPSVLPSSTWRQKPLSVKEEAGWPRTPEPIKSFVFVWGGGAWKWRKRQKNLQADFPLCAQWKSKRKGGIRLCFPD